MNPIQPILLHMSVDLRRDDARVSQELLDGADVGVALEHVRRERVTQ